MGDWLWDGGRPSIDFLNTLRDRKLGGRETLRSATDLAEWLGTAVFPGGDVEAGDADLTTALLLRAAIDETAFAALAGRPVRADAIELINTVARGGALAPSLAVDDRGRPYAWPDTTATAGLARVAVDAIELLTDGELARLRVCAADDCGIRFVDRSPARNRQWCSMRRCGNRSKARRHYARLRDGE